MSRYIDADALIKALRLEYPMMPMFKESQKEWEIKTEGYRKAEEVIKDAPSIDIVRCRECRHREEYPCKVYHDDDWFCADGEREGE